MNALSITAIAEWEHPANPGNVKTVRYVSGVDAYSDTAYVLPSKNRRDWIVNIHGHGSLGDQVFIRKDIRDHWLRAFQDGDFSMLSVDLRGNAWMCPAAAADLHCMMDWVRVEYGAERFIFVAGSMGGTSSLAYAILYPEDVTAVVAYCPATDIGRYYNLVEDDDRPVCQEIAQAIERAYGGIPAEMPTLYAKHSACVNAKELMGKDIIVIHGARDELIPVSEARELAGKMGGSLNFEYIEVPDGSHDSILNDIRVASYLKKF